MKTIIRISSFVLWGIITIFAWWYLGAPQFSGLEKVGIFAIVFLGSGILILLSRRWIESKLN
jgi:4-amino-4-deoxy-L-arabinose transferase-like glycosyltransferase